MVDAFSEVLSMVYKFLRYKITWGDTSFTLMGVIIASIALGLICGLIYRVLEDNKSEE